jgi:hypothetical protein
MKTIKKIIFIFKIATIVSFVCFGVLGIAYAGWVIFSGQEERVVLEEKNNINLDSPIVLNFSIPILRRNYVEKIKIYPEEDVEIKMDGTKRKVSIIPKENWNPESEYVISLPEDYSAMFTKINIQQFRFNTERYPEVRKVIPADGAKEVIVGAEDPLVIDFDKSTKGFYVKFELNPNGGVIYQNNPEKTQFKILPKEKVQDGTL